MSPIFDFVLVLLLKVSPFSIMCIRVKYVVDNMMVEKLLFVLFKFIVLKKYNIIIGKKWYLVMVANKVQSVKKRVILWKIRYWSVKNFIQLPLIIQLDFDSSVESVINLIISLVNHENRIPESQLRNENYSILLVDLWMEINFSLVHSWILVQCSNRAP